MIILLVRCTEIIFHLQIHVKNGETFFNGGLEMSQKPFFWLGTFIHAFFNYEIVSTLPTSQKLKFFCQKNPNSVKQLKI